VKSNDSTAPKARLSPENDLRPVTQESRIEQAESRTKEANTRIQLAEARTEQANTRTVQANTRTEEAEARSVEAIRASELRYRRLFETAQDGILILDADTGQVVDANPFMKDLLGYSQEEFLGKKLWEIGPFKGEAASKIAFAELQVKDRLRYEGLPLESKDGRRIEVEFISNAFQVDEKGLIQCNIRDIAERQKAEARTDQANIRTDQANTRTDQANTRTEEAQARGEQGIRASELRYRRLFETAQDGILILDADTGQVVDANPFMKDLLGYSQKEFLGRKLWEIGPFKGEAASKIAFAELQIKDRLRYEGLPLETKDGRRVEVEFISNAFQVDEKRLIQCNIRDITERRRNEARFRRLVDSNVQGVLFWNVEGAVTEGNDAFLNLVGYTREDLEAGRISWITMTPPEYADIDKHALLKIAESGTCAPFEKEFIRKDGSRVSVLVGATAFEDDPQQGVCFMLDLTERNRVDEQIVEQAALLDRAQDAIVVRDLEGKTLFWNKGAERMYGWTRLEAVGVNLNALLYANLKKFDNANGLTISKGEWHGELQHLTKDKRELTIEARWTLIRDSDGNPKSVLAINTDITEKKKIEAQFMRAQRMESIGTLAGGIAHDLNNILAPIMMSIGILKKISDQPQAKTILNTIELSAQRGADIIRQVLTFARGLEGQRIEVQPRQLLVDVENIIRDTFPKDIRLQFVVADDVWTILGDPTQIHQILLNLCVNARDSMPNGGNLTIHVENLPLDEYYAASRIETKPGRYVRFSVTDSGIGMSAELIDKIFEPFFTTKELNKGTGLGLSTVMAIVKSHDGIINVYSEPGRGTTFKLYLPAMEFCSKTSETEIEEASWPRGKGEVILVVDDEASILSITSQTLLAFGYRVLTATDGADALAIYIQHKDDIDVVLTDMMMPIMDGPASIQALMRVNPKVKIVAASGLSSHGLLGKATGVGVKHFLNKPYPAGMLLRTMRKVIDEAF
jgi:PAS domain S-box-containing protein